MADKLAVALAMLLVARSSLAIDYRSLMLTSKIMYYDNPHVKLDVRYFGEEGFPYVTLAHPVTPYNDFHVILYTKVFSQPPNLITHAPLSLCQVLHDQQFGANHTISQFNIPQIFNLANRTCPIEKEYIRLSPYIIPAKFSLDTDIGCGYQNVEAHLLKCDEEEQDGGGGGGAGQMKQCETLLKTSTLALLSNDQCRDEEQAKKVEEEEEEKKVEEMVYDGWIQENVIATVAQLL